MKSREYTEEEVRKMFLNHIRGLAAYWDSVEGRTSREKLDGLAFSILVMLDGGSALPGFDVSPSPHPSDKEFHIDEGTNYFPSDGECQIAGCLHEEYHK